MAFTNLSIHYAAIMALRKELENAPPGQVSKRTAQFGGWPVPSFLYVVPHCIAAMSRDYVKLAPTHAQFVKLCAVRVKASGVSLRLAATAYVYEVVLPACPVPLDTLLKF